MPYEIVVEDVAARSIAAVHVSVPVGAVPQPGPALDKVCVPARHEGIQRTATTSSSTTTCGPARRWRSISASK